MELVLLFFFAGIFACCIRSNIWAFVLMVNGLLFGVRQLRKVLIATREDYAVRSFDPALERSCTASSLCCASISVAAVVRLCCQAICDDVESDIIALVQITLRYLQCIFLTCKSFGL